MASYRVIGDFLIPSNDTSPNLLVINNQSPVTIYLPKWRTRIRVTLTQCSALDLTIDCNSDNYFTNDSKDYKQLTIQGCEENLGKRFILLAVNRRWILSRAVPKSIFLKGA